MELVKKVLPQAKQLIEIAEKLSDEDLKKLLEIGQSLLAAQSMMIFTALMLGVIIGANMK